MDTSVESKRRKGSRVLAMGCGSLVGVMVGVLFAYLWWANQLPPPERVIRVLPNPNGYDACTTALLDLASVPEPGDLLDKPWEADLAALRAQLVPRKDELDEFRRAMALPYVTPAQVSDVDLQRFAGYRSVCRQFAGEARVALAGGDRATALQRSLDAMELGAKITHGGAFIHFLVGSSCQAIGIASAESCFGPLRPEDAASIGARLDRIIDELPPSVEVMENERRLTMKSMRETLAGRSPLQGTVAAAGGTPSQFDAARDRFTLALYPKPWGYRKMGEYYRALLAEIRKPYPNRKELPPLPEEDPVIGGSFVGILDISFIFARTEAQLRLLRGRLAVEEYRARRKQLPNSLAELTPQILREAPRDPFSEKVLRYRRRGTSYVLYSVGPDLKDNGGTAVPTRLDLDSVGDVLADQLSQRQSARSRSPRPTSGASR